MPDRIYAIPDGTKQVQVTENSLDLDQVGNALDIPAVTNINDEVTVELWFKHGASYNANEMLHDNFHGTTNANRGWIIDLSNGKIRFAVLNNPSATNSVYYTYPTSLLDNQWHHVAMTIDANDVYKYYIDGVLVHTQTGTGMMGSFSRNHISRLGARGGTPGPHTFVLYPFNGQLKDFAVWSEIRTANQIATSHLTHSVTTNSNTMYYYPCDEGTGNNVNDQLTGLAAVRTVPTINLNWASSTVTVTQFVNNGYRFGFNGKESDGEITGQGNIYNYGARMFNTRLGRWFAMDPLGQFASPYLYGANSPIVLKDRDGKWVPRVNSEGQIVLKREKGDNYESLMKFFGGIENAKNYLPEQVMNLLVESKDEVVNKMPVMVLNSSNVYSQATNDHHADINGTKYLNDNSEKAPESNYNCHAAALNGSSGVPFHNAKAIEETSERNDILLDPLFYENVSSQKAIFGTTVITFGDNHSAIFFGRSKDGTTYVFSKPGSLVGPDIAPIKYVILGPLAVDYPENMNQIGISYGFVGNPGNWSYGNAQDRAKGNMRSDGTLKGIIQETGSGYFNPATPIVDDNVQARDNTTVVLNKKASLFYQETLD